jgi:hypothetical protein
MIEAALRMTLRSRGWRRDATGVGWGREFRLSDGGVVSGWEGKNLAGSFDVCSQLYTTAGIVKNRFDKPASKMIPFVASCIHAMLSVLTVLVGEGINTGYVRNLEALSF